MNTIKSIIHGVCQELEVSEEQLKSKSRKRPIAEARFITSKLLRTKKKLPLKAIGRQLKRDHSTIIYHLNTFGNLYLTAPEFAEKFDRCSIAIN